MFGRFALALLPAAAISTFAWAQSDDSQMRAPAFVMAAAQSDQFEIAEGQMAASKGDPAVRRFGEMMVRDHTKTSAALMAAAQQAGLPQMPPPPPRPDQQQMMAQLQNLQGNQFNATYLEQQVMSHRQALALMTSYARTGDVPALRAAAKQAMPIVREHLAMAEKMAHEGRAAAQ